MVKKPKDGILGTDEGHLAISRVGRRGEIREGQGGYPNFLYACMYIYVGCMLAFSTLKFSLDISISWMGQSIYSPYSPYSPYMITVIVGVSRSGCMG